MNADTPATPLESLSREELIAQVTSLRRELVTMKRIADAIPHIVWTMSADGSPTYFNAKWTDHTGLDLARTIEVGAWSFIHPEDLPRFEADLRQARAGVTAFESTYRLRDANDGSHRWHAARIVPVMGEGGALTSWVATATNVHDERARQDEQRYLVLASEVLGTSLELRQTLSDVAKLLVPHMADWCAIDLLTEGGTLDRQAVAHVDPSKVALAWDLWKRAPPKPDDEHGVYAAIRRREPEVVPELTADTLAAMIPDPEILALVRGLGLRSSMTVPLVARDRVIGAVTLVTSESGRTYGPSDLAFATQLAQRIGVAVENARLHGAVEQARAAAEVLAVDVVEQSRAVEKALVGMRAERDAALKGRSTAQSSEARDEDA